MKLNVRASTSLIFFTLALMPLTGYAGDDQPSHSATGAQREPASFKPDTIFQQIDKSKDPNAKPVQTTPETAQPSDKAPGEGESDYGLSGDWGGVRKKLQDRGLGIAVTYKGDWMRNFHGGTEPRSLYLDNLDLKFLIDGEKAFGAKGFSFLVYGLGNSASTRDTTLAQASGTVQGVDNIETTYSDLHLYEAWGQYLNEDLHFSVLFGLHDLNSEFYVTDTSTLFLNPSPGVGTELAVSGINGPSIFPYTSSCLRLRYEPSRQSYAQAAVFDGISGSPGQPNGTYFPITGKNGQLLIAEGGLTGTEKSPYKFALGAWTHAGAGDHSGWVAGSGAYLLGDKTLSEGVSAYFRIGFATEKEAAVRSNFMTGVVFKGLLPGRADDQFGLALQEVNPSDSSAPPEVGLEAVYRLEIIKGASLIPDLQYFLHPGMLNDSANSLAGGARIELSL